MVDGATRRELLVNSSIVVVTGGLSGCLNFGESTDSVTSTTQTTPESTTVTMQTTTSRTTTNDTPTTYRMSDWGATVRSDVDSELRIKFVLKRDGEPVQETTRTMDNMDIVKVQNLFDDSAGSTLHVYHDGNELIHVGINDYTKYKIVVRSVSEAEVISKKEV